MERWGTFHGFSSIRTLVDLAAGCRRAGGPHHDRGNVESRFAGAQGREWRLQEDTLSPRTGRSGCFQRTHELLAQLGPTRGSQPGTQAGRHALRGKEMWKCVGGDGSCRWDTCAARGALTRRRGTQGCVHKHRSVPPTVGGCRPRRAGLACVFSRATGFIGPSLPIFSTYNMRPSEDFTQAIFGRDWRMFNPVKE